MKQVAARFPCTRREPSRRCCIRWALATFDRLPFAQGNIPYEPGSVTGVNAATPASSINDAQIAHIAYTAGVIDVTAAEQALQKTQNPQVRAFAEVMARDHAAVNDQALALVKKLGVTPQDNPTSQSLASNAADEQKSLGALSGSEYDKAYAANEVAFHQAVNDALADTLIPSAQNEELKALLETGLKLFQSHQAHAKQLVQSLK